LWYSGIWVGTAVQVGHRSSGTDPSILPDGPLKKESGRWVALLKSEEDGPDDLWLSDIAKIVPVIERSSVFFTRSFTNE
jgi:hypothetical protein